jgi:hypothetical protein
MAGRGPAMTVGATHNLIIDAPADHRRRPEVWVGLAEQSVTLSQACFFYL